MVSLSSADGEWEKPERLDSGGFTSLIALGLEVTLLASKAAYRRIRLEGLHELDLRPRN